jgi:hypothetical protein
MMAINPNELVINDDNFQRYLDPTVNGEKVARGLIPRNYALNPVGSGTGAVAGLTMPLIPRSEWSARIKEMEEAKTRLSDYRRIGNNGLPIPSLDQNGQGFCATEDTEILTEKGWVKYPDYNWTDPVATVNQATHLLEYQQPFERHVYEYDGPMIYSTNRRIDFGVTPDHQMYVRKWDESKRTLSSRYSFVRAGDLGWYSGLLAAPSGHIGTELVELEVEGDRRYCGDDFMALLSVIISDGYAGETINTKNWVGFCCFHPERYPQVKALAQRVGFRENPSRQGVFARYNAGALANWIRHHCYLANKPAKSHFKKIPAIVKVASTRQIKLFFDWYGDKNHNQNNATQFFTSSKRLADDLQELHLKVGIRSSIGQREGRVAVYRKTGQEIKGGVNYTLTVSSTDQLCLDKKKHIETERYKGLVYCAGVPNHTLLTRRNGSVLISSNCWAYSTGMALMMSRMMSNQPYVRLSPHAVACKIKGFRDEGGWGALSMEFAVKNGYPSDKFWPQKSMSRSYDTLTTWGNAEKHRVQEGYWDLDAKVYDRNLTFDQVMTCLMMRIPIVGDFNWWGHSVCLLDPVEVEPGSFGVRIINSWTDNWGNLGEGVLQGNKAIPDGAVAPRVTTASQD